MKERMHEDEPRIIDLDRIMKEWAIKQFDRNERHSLEKKFGKLTDENLVVELERDALRVEHDKPKYPEQKEKPQNHTLFKSTFVNNTNQPQEYALRNERRSAITCSYTMQTGFTFGKELEISIGLPENPVLEASMEGTISKEFRQDKGYELSKEDEITWSIDTTIRVPENHKTTAELVIKEQEDEGGFEMKSYFSGLFKVHFKKGHVLLITITGGNLKTIFEARDGFGFDEKTKRVCYVSKGRCRFKYGIEQFVKLTEEPIAR